MEGALLDSGGIPQDAYDAKKARLLGTPIGSNMRLVAAWDVFPAVKVVRIDHAACFAQLLGEPDVALAELVRQTDRPIASSTLRMMDDGRKVTSAIVTVTMLQPKPCSLRRRYSSRSILARSPT